MVADTFAPKKESVFDSTLSKTFLGEYLAKSCFILFNELIGRVRNLFFQSSREILGRFTFVLSEVILKFPSSSFFPYS